MNKITLGLAAAGLLASASVQAATPRPILLASGTYTSTGTVQSTNDASTGTHACALVGLVPNGPSNAVITYPGPNKAGFNLYTPFSGAVQICNTFGNTPAGGLTSWSPTATCVVDALSGDAPSSQVSFSFTNTYTDGYSAIGSTSVSIPPDAAVGAGCQATIVTTLVRSGR